MHLRLENCLLSWTAIINPSMPVSVHCLGVNALKGIINSKALILGQ